MPKKLKTQKAPSARVFYPNMPALFTVQELANFFGLSTATVIIRCRRQPHLVPPFINIGTETRPQYRFPADDVKQFIEYLMKQKKVAQKDTSIHGVGNTIEVVTGTDDVIEDILMEPIEN